jgi:hypothetical protein
MFLIDAFLAFGDSMTNRQYQTRDQECIGEKETEEECEEWR